MSASDVKNYLEKIYKVPVMNVRTINLTGPMHMHKQLGFIYKERDVKVAHVTLVRVVWLFSFSPGDFSASYYSIYNYTIGEMSSLLCNAYSLVCYLSFSHRFSSMKYR